MFGRKENNNYYNNYSQDGYDDYSYENYDQNNYSQYSQYSQEDYGYDDYSNEEYQDYDQDLQYTQVNHRSRRPFPWFLLILLIIGIVVFIWAINRINKNKPAQSDLTDNVYSAAESTIIENETSSQTEVQPAQTENPEGKTLSAFSEVMQLVEYEASKGEKNFTLLCTQELYDSLLEERDISTFGSVRETPLDEILENCAGTKGYTYTCYEQIYKIDVEITSMLAGYEIVNAWKKGATSELPELERQTYEKAESLVSELRTESQIETAYAIHDWICNNVTYTIDESTENDDCAIGAILYGEANCDGYSDAFYLLGTMMGLEVRVQTGDADSPEENEEYSAAGHMWNLLKIDNKWHHVDVTWDDGSEEGVILYCWFNVGSGTMQNTHYWHSDTTVEIAQDTDLSTRPSNEYHIYTLDDFQAAVSDSVSRNLPIAFFVFDNAELYSYKDNLQNYLANAWFYGSYSYMEIDEMMTIVFVP